MSDNSTKLYDIKFRRTLQCIFEKDVFFMHTLNKSEKSSTQKLMQLEIALNQD